MKALVTGSEGFVGRHLIPALEDRGIFVTAIDIKRNFDCMEWFQIATEQFDYVFHLAADIGGRQKIETAQDELSQNLLLDANMFAWALRTNAKHVIYFSSSAAYPIEFQTHELHQKLYEEMIDLDDLRLPDSTYGWAKVSGEMIARYAELRGLKVSIMRPFSGYGEDQDPDYPFRAFLERVKQKVNPFTVWGDGNQVRDFIHIDDIVGATLAAIDHDMPGPLNLGWGRPTSFNELAEMMVSRETKIDHVLHAPVGVEYRVADNTKMTSFYEPRITLEEGIWYATRN